MLRDYQLEVLEPLRERFVYGDAPGSGKTATTLSWLSRTRANRTLIVAPLPVLHHWERQALEWYPELDVVLGGGSVRQRVEARSHIGGMLPQALVVNYETMRGDANELLKMGWDAVIFDEAHRLKNRRALVHKAAVKFARRVPLLVEVTGTPITGFAEEAWAMFHMLDPKRFSSFWRWAHEHFHVYPRHVGRPEPIMEIGDPKPGALEAIRAELGLALIQRPLELLLPDMPPVTETILEIDLSPAERRAYDQMAKHKWAELEGDVIQASTKIAQITRLRQLASDWASWNADTVEPGSKVKVVSELIGDLHEQVVVFVAFKATARQLVELVGHDRAVSFTGYESTNEREERIRRFQSGQAQAIVGTYGAMKEGVDGLQVARHMILLDPPAEWTPTEKEQAIGRVRRSGQAADNIFVTVVVARDTTDQFVAEVITGKQEVINTITPMQYPLRGSMTA